jgi:peptide chain release factor 1
VLDVPGETHVEMTGSDLTQLSNEAGCHKLQRVPPTERNGRVHTSSVTVAVISSDSFKEREIVISDSDLKLEWYSGTGCGGQNRNKVQTSCRLTHVPTGIVQTAQTRSRENSYQQALVGLTGLLKEQNAKQQHSIVSYQRAVQINPGNTAIRTYCFQHGVVKATNGKKITIKQFEKGLLDLLW